jgi:trans-2,3-dihydro-3-hydroxyanthranilate isomerase
VTVTPHGRGYSSKLQLRPSVDVPTDRLDPALVARVLSLPDAMVQDAWFASVGARFGIARLASAEAVDAAVLDRVQWQQHLSHAWSPHIFFFAGDPRGDRALYARMFAPALGIDEDPATGSAVAALAASVALREMNCELVLHVRQGVRLGRPSDIHARATARDGALTRVELVGTSVIVAEGVIEAP